MVSLPTGVTATAIAAGQLSAYALGSNGSVYAWGLGSNGELGNGSTTSAQTTPVVVSLPVGVTATAIGATGYTGYAMGSNGTLYAWGMGPDGELGNGSTSSTQATPVAVSLPTGVRATAIAGGTETAYALGSNGTLYAWGYGSDGELGNNTTSSLSTPAIVQIPTGVTITALAAGELSGYALGTNGTMYAWGSDTEGQVGNNSANDPQTKPIAVSLPAGVTATAIGASELTGFAIGSNGTLYAWGLGLDGNLGNGTTTFSQTTPVAATLPTGVVPTSLGSESQSETGYAIVRPATTLSQGTPTSATITAGAGYSGQLTVTNLPTGGGSLTWTTTTSSSEVNVSSSGAVTVPTSVTTPGTVTMSGTVSDAIGDTGNWSFTLTVTGTPPMISPVNSATFTEGQAGTFTVTATGNPLPMISGTGSLPIGVTLTSAGVLSGTPTQSGTFPITLTATNGVPPDATLGFTLTVDGPPTITSANSATFTQGQAGSFTVTASGTPSSMFSETGTLPTGMTLSSGGVLAGTPTQSGSFPITITASNGHGSDTQGFNITVVAPVTLCTPGYYSSTGYTPCAAASPGTYVATTGATSATNCLAGTYNPSTGSTSAAACLAADPGSYVGSPGSGSETPCGLGTYSSTSGASSCTNAPPGTYVATTGATSATNCLAGTYNPSTGSTSAAACLAADPGSYVGSPGSGSETPCGLGTYSSTSGCIQLHECPARHLRGHHRGHVGHQLSGRHLQPEHRLDQRGCVPRRRPRKLRGLARVRLGDPVWPRHL